MSVRGALWRSAALLYVLIAMAWLVRGLTPGPRYPLSTIVLDYLASAAFLGLAAWLAAKSAGSWGFRLLSLGLVGAAAAYNLQAGAANARFEVPGAILLHGAGVAACVAGLMLLAMARPTGASRILIAVAAGALSAISAGYAPSVDFLISFGLVTPLFAMIPWRARAGATTADADNRARAVGSASATLAALTVVIVGAARLTQGLDTPGLLGQVPRVSLSGPIVWRQPVGLGWLGPQVSAFWVDRFVAVAVFGVLVWAIVRTRPIDTDRLAVKSFVYAMLIAVVGGVYVVGVVRIDASFGLDSDWLAPPQVAAASLAALVFQPVRAGLERLADRLVYGRRLAPHEVVARIGALTRVGSGGSEALRSLAELTARTLGTSSAAVQPAVPDGQSTYRWPSRGQAPSHEQRIPVTHRGVVVGALLVPATPRGGLPRGRRAHLPDLLRVAGVVLHSTAMSVDLDRRLRAEQARSDEIRASRWRIVTAQDGERRDLERDLHDVAQPAMTSVRLALGLVNHLAGGPNEDAYGSALENLHGHIEMAAAGLRQTLHGIDPPALITAGIVPALRATAESLRIEVDFRVGVRAADKRFDRLVEATVYTCCSEALHNSAKHSPGAHVVLSLDLDDDGWLYFEVGDDGKGFAPETVRSGGGLQNIADRLAAVGGSLAIDARPAAGTRVRGTVPTSSRLAGSARFTEPVTTLPPTVF